MAEQGNALQGKESGGSIWTRKFGPLPLWAYGLIVFALVAAYRLYSNSKQQQAAASSTDTTATNPALAPPLVFQNFNTEIEPTQPPGGGRPWPPVWPPVTTPPPQPPPPAPIPVPSPVVPAPGPGPIKTPGVPPPSGQWVTVGKWTSSNTPWNSTLWGIAQHITGNGNNWQAIWNNPQNASLKSRRKDPKLIQPGDKVWVPA